MRGFEPPRRRFAFDAVLFDLDGTLVATDRFWVAAAERGARRAFGELGLSRPLPSAAQWMSLVGLPLELGFSQLFADLDAAARARVLARCLEAEGEALRAGGAELLPGARPVLEALRARGVRTAIASNCGAGYLEAMLTGLGLDALVDEALCLDSPGIATKTDMLRVLLERFETRSAVMVGDRRGDAEAAHANGLPHVHLARGFAPAGEQVECEARLDGLDGLLARLAGRDAWITAALSRIGALPARVPSTVRTVAITGGELAGKTLFARDAARLAAAGGRRARVVAAGDRGPELVRALLAPVAPVARGELGELVLVEGAGLDAPGLRSAFDRVVRLEIGAATLARRRAARGLLGGPSSSGTSGAAEPGEGAALDPGGALLVLAADNPLGPP